MTNRMKILTYIIVVLALISIVINATKINLEKPFEGESTIALIGIVAAFCAIVIMALFMVAKKVTEQTK